jgi:hypothetical protein
MRHGPARMLILVMVLSGVGAAALAAGKPAGKPKGSAKPATPPEAGSWKVRVTPDAGATAKGEKEIEDTLVLKNGKFHSPACDPYGFLPAPYRVEGSTWISDTESKTDGKIHWHGEASGDSMTGWMVWTKLDGSMLNYTFTGSRAGSQGSQTQPSPGGGKSKN